MSKQMSDTDESRGEGGTEHEKVNQSVEDALPEGADSGAGTSISSFLANGGIKEMLLQEDFHDPETGHSYGKAHLVADIVNVMRMDAKQIARTHGIEIEVDKMSPQRAAELLEGVAKQDGVSIIEVFQEIEDHNDKVLAKQLNEEQYEQYNRFKEQMLYSVKTEE